MLYTNVWCEDTNLLSLSLSSIRVGRANGAADKPRAFRINADRREAIYAEAQSASSAG
jgi:hypothetical protein